MISWHDPGIARMSADVTASVRQRSPLAVDGVSPRGCPIIVVEAAAEPKIAQ